MAKFIANICIIVLMFINGLCSLMYGWGLEIQSLGWVIGTFIATLVLLVLSTAVNKSEEK